MALQYLSDNIAQYKSPSTLLIFEIPALKYIVPVGTHIRISHAKKFKPFNVATVGTNLKLSLDTTDEQVRLE